MNKTRFRKAFFALVAGLVLSVLTLAACAPTVPQTEPESPAVEAPGEIQRVSLEESKTAFDNGEAIFLDVRSASSYATGHVPGASSIPLAELQSRIGELNRDQWIITYCT